MNFLLNPHAAMVGIPLTIFGVLLTGFTFSYSDLAQAKQKADSAQKAIDRAENCSVVDRIYEGHYYAFREIRPDGKTWETLLSDGNLLCSLDGSTAMVNGKVAAFIRKTSGKEMVEKIKSRFGVDENGQTLIPREFKAAKSTLYAPDFAKRGPATPGKRSSSFLDWIFPSTPEKPNSASIK
jgi:hypothetical protein